MGPNSGGGKKNKNAGKTNVATRARFSKAPSKLVDRFKKKGINRDIREYEDSKKSSSRGAGGSSGRGAGGSSGRGAGGSSSAIKDTPLDKKKIEGKGLERLNLPQHLVTQLLTLFEGPRPKDKAPDVRPPKAIPDVSLPSDREQTVVSTPKDAKKADVPLVSMKKKDDSPFLLSSAPGSQSKQKTNSRGQTLQSLYSKYGFSPSEIKSIVKNDKCSSDNEQFLALLIACREHSFPTPAEVEKSPTPESSNEDLNNEIEVLTSIFESDVFHENFVAFGCLPCCRISILTEIDDVNFEIRMFILNADQYPNKQSKLYGWLIDPVAISIGKTVGVTHAASSCLSADSMRELSLAAMEKIQYQHVQSEAPVAFDFVQILNETVPEHLASASVAGATTTTKRGKTSSIGGGGGGGGGKRVVSSAKPPPKKEVSGKAPLKPEDKKALSKAADTKGKSQKGTAGTGKGKGKAQAQEAVEEAPSKRPKLPPMPVTFHIKKPEYRSAYGAALSKGLGRNAAQALVRDTF
jgi:hypothetical protein